MIEHDIVNHGRSLRRGAPRTSAAEWQPAPDRRAWHHEVVDADAWKNAGLYDPDDPAADERRALLEYLTAKGATLGQMIEARRLGRLPGVAGDLVIASKPVGLIRFDGQVACVDHAA